MHGDTIFKLTNLLEIWLGTHLLLKGLQQMSGSNYIPPEIPSGWVMGMVWIAFGMVVGLIWISFVLAMLLEQKMNGKSRFTATKMVTISFVLIFSAISASVGTYLTYKHPYRLGPCDCTATEWGLSCLPCDCGLHGVCDSGQYGSGRCSCDVGFAGDSCETCDAHHKPVGSCDLCKIGFAGLKCEYCDVGYSHENCDVCADGWQPWSHNSSIFPFVTSKDPGDSGRHICDECKPNYWGYYCKNCPIGNDVPKITLTKNFPIQNGTRVKHKGKRGVVLSMQVQKNSKWATSYDYNIANQLVLQQTRVIVQYDSDKSRSKEWIILDDLEGVQCNNRGTCVDDKSHQQRNPDWDKTCTFSPALQECSIDKDCLISENCKGVCKGLDMPINAIWSATMDNALCSSDEDCYKPVYGDGEVIQDYKGGRCVNRGCCTESFHGDGHCDCDPSFFGPPLENGQQPSKKSPACDFCPGYDWITENPTTICSGGKGTCTPSMSRTNDYVDMRCTCGTNIFTDQDGITYPDKIIAWSGDLCECGDWNEDSRCDICASGYWGDKCATCPGGPGLQSCGGLEKGQCNSGRYGDGSCNCKLGIDSSWMLAPFVKRYTAETVGYNKAQSNWTCTECAPNFWGDKCERCPGTKAIKMSEIDDIKQPIGSFKLGPGQSSTTPEPLCNRGHCSLACNRGGWCDWGRQGTGKCTCWSNKRLNSATWSPFDNVCIGNNTALEDCPSYGYCSGGSSSRTVSTKCGPESEWVGDKKNMNIPGLNWSPYDDWKATESGKRSSFRYNEECSDIGEGICYKWMPIDFRPTNDLMTCIK